MNRPAPLLALIVAAGVVGCTPDVETTYGRTRGKSINGTNALNALFRERGHSTRTAVRYTEALSEWAGVIVRFAPHPGPPEKEEATWLREWLEGKPGRKAIYVPADYTTDVEFWSGMLAALPPKTELQDKARIQTRLDESKKAATAPRHNRGRPVAEVDEWFGTTPTDLQKPTATAIAAELDGPWAEGIDAPAAALPVREAIRAENSEPVLLEDGDGHKLIITWNFGTVDDPRGDVLVLSNGAPLLNAGLLNKARRPLATRVVDWVGAQPVNVAFVEGANVTADSGDASVSPFHLLFITPFNWITSHLGAFGVLTCLALAATIGRPRREAAVAAVERPSAHPIALGTILARTRQVDVARDLIEAYLRWREPSAATGRNEPKPTSPRRVPHA